MNVTLTILCDNTVRPQAGLIGEHGFACHIETPDGGYLFDAGQGLGIVQNARILGKDLTTLRAVALSHGHYDHAGGLPEVLHQCGPVDVHAHPEVFTPRYRTTGTLRRFIGVPHRREYLEALGARFHLESDWTTIAPGLHLCGEVPRTTSFEKGDRLMTAVRPDGSEEPCDPLRDDLSLVIESANGPILVLGCAHAGLVNILRHVQGRLGCESIHAVIGGTHLGFAGDEQFAATLEALEQFQVKRIGVSHCTGLPRAAQLQAALDERFFFATVGTQVEG